MRKLLIIIFVYIVQFSPSYGNLNGKGLICECVFCPSSSIEFGTYYEGKNPSVYGYLFENDKVIFLKVTKDKNNRISFKESDVYEPIKYRLSIDYITWGKNYSNSYKYKLNRENLILEKTIINGKKPGTIRECKVYTKMEFLKVQEKIISNYQKNIGKTFKPKKDFEKKLNKNKI